MRAPAPAPDDHDFFRSIPWCAKLLAEPDVVVVATSVRERKASTEDEVAAVTLKTNDTIPAWLTFYKKPLHPAEGSAPTDGAPVDEVFNLLHLGPGVNGYAHHASGGIVGVLFDECMAILGRLNSAGGKFTAAGVCVTANLHIRYLKTIPTPGVYLVMARLAEVKGRKFYLQGEIRDREGVVLASAESLWVEVKAETKL